MRNVEENSSWTESAKEQEMEGGDLVVVTLKCHSPALLCPLPHSQSCWG